jgi:periplasmic protein TonB
MCSGMRTSSGLISLALHALGVAVLLVLGSVTLSNPEPKLKLGRDAVPLAPLSWHRSGGGGQRESLPASKGRLPPIAHNRVFTPPTAHILNEHPKLPVEQALLVDPDIPIPEVRADRIGSPWGVDGPLSGGRGGPAGIGDHGCCGVGNESGPSAGGDPGSMTGRTVRPKLSRGLQVVFMLESEYSDEARKAHFQGVVVVAAQIGTDGLAHEVHVVRPLGLGLDEKAIEAVARWKFRPAIADGRPVAWPATIEVTFRLL